MTRVALVVDDEEPIRYAIADRLMEAGFEVLQAENSDVALQVLADREDITDLITDVKMPGSIDGAALARIVDKHREGISIMVISGHASPNALRLPPSAGFMQKPFSSEALLRVLQSS